ncbi:ankyrin repeat-containing domain protein [Aspergillus pseudoustus]|uniref:Ankyrin repeat-containing domain protein n=1 Tax=Aspergillus pseudoustus TaxID=1810923 RepID=A0ABR4J4M5_9EURO
MRSLQPGFWGVPAATSEGGVEFELKMGVRDFLPILVLSDDSRLVMQYLLTETGVDVNHRHPLFGSALYNAAAINNADIVKLLLSKGANVNQTGGRWYTSLQMSVAHSKSTDTLSVLLQAGADVNQQGGNNDNGRQTALMTAAHANNRKAVAVLLSQPEIDINLLSCREETIAHFLSRAGDADNLRKLIAEHPEVDIKCSGLAGTALNAATYLALSQFTDGHDEVVKILLEQGLSPLETPPGEEFSIHGWAKYLEKEAEEEEQEFPAALERILRWRKYSRESIK